MVDLHMHSNFSDGSDSVIDIFNKTKDYSYFSITDHDTLDSTLYIIKNGLNKGNFINGIELSTVDENNSIHILLYNFNPLDINLINLVEEIKQIRKYRIIKRIEILKEKYNIEINDEDKKYILSLDNPSKVNLADSLIKYGYSNSISDAINVYLSDKVFVKKLTSEYVIKKLKNIKGIISWAHPLGGIGEERIDKDKFLNRLDRFKEYGIDSLECIYSLYDDNEQKFLVNEAKNRGLLISGGSDYHGTRKKVSLGELSADGIDNSNLITINKMF